jgi:riboflavin synthase
MFTGIVSVAAPIAKIVDKPGLRTLTLRFPWRQRFLLRRGASVSLDGVCMTVTTKRGRDVTFDAMDETLEKTTIGLIKEGDLLNIERSFKTGAEIGGHILSGHVTEKARIIQIDKPENNHIITFQVPKKYMKYLFEKGFVALNGCSLTIVDVNYEAATFAVHLIPETLTVTTFGQKKVGDEVNFEIDSKTQTLVDTTERLQKIEGSDLHKQYKNNQ